MIEKRINRFYASTPLNDRPVVSSGYSTPVIYYSQAGDTAVFTERISNAKVAENGRQKVWIQSLAENGAGNIRDTKKAEVKGIKSDFKDAKAEMRKDFKDARQDMKDSGMNKKDIRASSTEMFKAMKDQRRDLAKKMQMNVFEARKNALVKELTVTFNNLTNIRGRINERIIKLEIEGKTVADAKTTLAVADEKLAKANTAIDAFSSLNYSPSNANASSTGSSSVAEVELDKPRLAGDTAIKSVKEARDSLKKVIEIISSIK